MHRFPLLLLALAGCPQEPTPTETPDPGEDVREPCANFEEDRQVFWGDLHVHTENSFDAWVFDVRNDPDDAYAFATGEPVDLPPLGPDGKGTVTVQLERPLDFAAVTDHAEYLGEVRACSQEGSAVYDTPTCVDYRQGNDDAIRLWGFNLTDPSADRFEALCEDGIDCLGDARDVWSEIQGAAERWYDRTETCEFTSFVAYEYSAATNISNLHRNIIFRGTVVQDQPSAVFEYQTPLDLWRNLKATCLDQDNGCDLLAMPHNSNWSNGALFHVEYPADADEDEQRELAELRKDLEPVFEIYQHKGDSECMNGFDGVADDPLCGFEKLRDRDFKACGDEVGAGAMAGFGCISRNDFVRGFLTAGLAEEERIGVNPFQLGMSAATDTHNGIPGAVDEEQFKGHWGSNEETVAKRLSRGQITPSGIIFSAGGLMGVWAEENARDSLFDAMRRKETFGTSGPRIPVRFFAAESWDDGICADPDWVATAYDAGIPMGGELETDSAPSFVVDAWQDPMGASLQRIQIIKGWVGADGAYEEAVYEVAGNPDNGADVDLGTCSPTGSGDDHLCTVWTDPDYASGQRAWYYARVVQNPTCRWSWHQCLTFPEDDRPEVCDDPAVPKVVQERAWSSPIWVR